MKALSYKLNKVHSTPDGLTHCWGIVSGGDGNAKEFIIQTEDKKVAAILRMEKFSETGRGEYHFMRQYAASEESIDRILKLLGLPPRIKAKPKSKGLKPVIYKKDVDQYSEDGKTSCWQIWTGQFWIYTSNKELIVKIRNWKGVELREKCNHPFYRLFLVEKNKIDKIINLANLPPRKNK